MLLTTDKYSLIFWAILGLLIFVTFIRYIFYHKKLFAILRKEQPNFLKDIVGAPGRYRKFIFGDAVFENNEIEYLRIRVREALKTSFLFVVAFFGFIAIVVIRGCWHELY